MIIIPTGRGGNRWVSPEGCVMFTLHVQQDANSDLGCAPVFLQHLCGLAMVLSIRQIPGYEVSNDMLCTDIYISHLHQPN